MKNYRDIFYALPFPCLLLEPIEQGFVIREVNKKYCELSGNNSGHMLDKKYLAAFPETPEEEKNLKLRADSIERALKTGKPSKINCLRQDFNCPDNPQGRERYWQVENIPLKGKNGKIEYILNIARDKTEEIREEKEKTRIEQELIASRNKQHHFIDHNPDGLYSLDVNGKFLSVNKGLVELAEVCEEELLQMNFLPFCAPHHRDIIHQHFHKAMEKEMEVFEADFLSAKGKELVLRISLMPMIINGEVAGVFGIAKNITDLRNVRNALVSKEKKYQVLVQEGSDLTAILHPDGTYKYVSETSSSILGICPEEFIGKSAFDFIHPDDKERVIQNFSALENEKQVRIKPFRFIDGKGEWRWVETKATDQIDDPYVKGIVVNSREVTEIVEQNKKLEQIYERYRLAATATEDLIYDWDLEKDEVIRFFRGNQKPFGYERDEIDKREFWRNTIHPQEIKELKGVLKSALNDPSQTQVKTQYRLKRADGSYAHIIDRAHIVRDKAGKPLRLIGATSDVSGIVENKNALLIANTRFEYAMLATKEMIWDWDLENGDIQRSSSFKKLFGYDPPANASVENFWFEKIMRKDRERVIHSLQEAIKDKNTRKWRQEYCFVKKDGSKSYVIDRGYILRNDHGKAIRMVGAVLDVTDSRNLMRKIKKQNKILREVAWEQAHIVKAPLARLKGLIHLLEIESYEEWSREEILCHLKNSANELDDIIEKVIRKTEEIIPE